MYPFSFAAKNPAVNSSIEPIIFNVYTGISNVTISPALPSGIVYTMDTTTGILTISGTPTVAVPALQTYTITPIGAFIRKTSIDEFPQFINVLYGDMSIVGPRPLMIEHNYQYSELILSFPIAKLSVFIISKSCLERLS